MVLVELLLSKLCEPISWLALLLGLLTAYVVSFWNRVRRLPPGPTPLPLIGNIPQLRSPLPLYEKAIAWSRRYGDPFTVWVGPRPFVVASSKESFKDISGPLRNHVAGRAATNIGALQTRGFGDVVFGDFTPQWDVLRRLAHVAMRKYAVTEKLATLVAEKVDVEVDEILKDSDETQSEIVDFIEEIINNVLAVSSFGESFKKGDADYEKMRQASKNFETESPNGLPSDILPILGWIFIKQERSARRAMLDFVTVTDKMFAQAKQSWTPGQGRHFTDVLLNAREEFVAEDRNSAKYLTDENLRQVVFDIFGAGTGTSRSVLSVCCLLLANHPEIQEELRAEVLGEIGKEVCTVNDRERLPKTDSFLQETIRLNPPAPLSLPRRALADVTINGRAIPKDTDLMINVYAVNRDESIWGADAAEFKPFRFIDITKDQQTRGTNSFGIGARSCPGEKMAQSDMLYVLVRLLQTVKISCVNGPGTATLMKKNSDILLDPPRQNLIFKKLVDA